MDETVGNEVRGTASEGPDVRGAAGPEAAAPRSPEGAGALLRPADAGGAPPGPPPRVAKPLYPAWGALALMTVIWGYNWVVMKVALRYVEPALFAAMRVFLGAVLLFLVLLVLRRSLRPQHIGFTALVGLFQVTGSIGLMTWALVHGGAGKTSVLVYTMPIWLLFMSWGILGERLRGLQWLPVILAIGGLIFVIAPWSMQGTPGSNALAVGSGVSWAAATITLKIFSRRHKVDVLSLNAWQMLLGSIPLLVIAVLTTETAPQWTGTFIAALVFNVVFTAGVALGLWFYAVRALPAGTAGLGSLIAPVIGVLSAWFQLGERPDVFETVGIVLIVSALVMLTVRQIMAGRAARSAAVDAE